MNTITGIVQKIIYFNSSNNFYILSVKPLSNIKSVQLDKSYQTITVKGNIENITTMYENDIFTFDLKEKPDQKYGMQYEIQRITNEYPEKPKEQIEMLDGLVRYYGTLNDLKCIRNTDFSVIDEPYKIFKTLEFSNSVLSILEQFNPPDMYRKWASDYNLTHEDLNAFSQYCKSINVPLESLDGNVAEALHRSDIPVNIILDICKSRMQQGLPTPDRNDKYLFDLTLSTAIRELSKENMDTIFSMNIVREKAMTMRGMRNPNTFNTLMTELPENSHIIVIDNNVMSRKNFQYEKCIENAILNTITYDNNIYDQYLEYLKDRGLVLNNKQLLFAKYVFTTNISALTGGAGTGKSFTLGTIVQFLRAYGYDVVCIAPTAQAAKVLKDYTKGDTSTIHSFLASESECDYLIIDESSMIGNALCSEIIEYVRATNCSLAFSGDNDQLPPIEEGAPYRDILATLDSTVELDEIYRQKDKALIDVLTTAKQGMFNINATNEWQSYGSQCVYKHYSIVDDIIPTLLEQIKNVGVENVGIISPTNKVVTDINTSLQALLNPQEDVVETKTTKYGVGDPVILKTNKPYAIESNLNVAQRMMTHNNDKVTYIFPDEPLKVVKAYNGDRGHVVKVLNKTQFIVELEDTIDMFGNNHRIIFDTSSGREELTTSQVTLGYAMTVHKAQGSQFETVVFVCPVTRKAMTSRSMIYTALSRAKGNIIVFTQTRFSNITTDRNTLMRTLI